MYFIMESTHIYLEKLGFSAKTESANFGETFLNTITINYETNSKISIPFIFFKNKESLFEYYLNEWNKNEISYFIAVDSDKSYILNAKEKTKNIDILKSSLVIDDFDYGTNTVGYNNIELEKLPYTKENINNSYFFDYVLKKQKEVKNEVDTYLLNNLVALKEELSKFDTDNENINGLILKSLFVKYLEDRKILTDINFTEVLKKGNPSELIKVFSEIAVINGDILKKDLKVTKEHIKELAIFYSHDYKEYKKGQPNLFYPYKFDKIPIQLISNVYEEFLGRTNKKEKKSKGIFYTRTFVIDFMLSHTIYPKIEKQSHSTILDPACGSGAFLVRAFKKILKSQPKKYLSIDEKAEILQKQIFGIDTDVNALQITAFSLYLTLLDGINKNEIQEQLKKRNPILPSLIGYNLLKKNTIVDDIKFEVKVNSNVYSFTKFDFIVVNPPWTELKKSEEKDKDVKRIRNEIDRNTLFENVSKYQTSQAFLLKIDKLCHSETDIAIIVNNSNFFNIGSGNLKPQKFRQEILEKYRLKYFYELSDVSEILFKGTKHPSAVLILDKKNPTDNHTVKYITPRLTIFSKKLKLISYSSKDVKEVKQKDLQKEDVLWRVFAKGNWDDYKLLKRIEFKKNNDINVIFCGRGINPNKATPKSDKSILKELVEANYLRKFYIEKTNTININQAFERERVDKKNLFSGSRILVKRMPSVKDKLKLTTVFVENELYFKEQIISLKLNHQNLHKAFSSLLNSSLIGYYFNNTSAQTNKGKKKPSIRHQELINLPFIRLSEDNIKKLNLLYDKINSNKGQNLKTDNLEKELDELVFGLYGLLEFEKEIINEFYQINVERKNDVVEPQDIQNYIEAFRDTYQLMIKENLRLNASFIISKNIGAVVKFDIVDKNGSIREIKQGGFTQRQILNLVKERQIQKELLNGSINEEKVKIYEEKNFYIIKSNQFKDWTKRQAIEDANEEVKEMLKKLL